MGSSGTGKFETYSPRTPSQDQCGEPIEADLEEVGSSERVVAGSGLPAAGDAVRVRPELTDGRLVVEDSTGASVGLLPTEFSYLSICIARATSYSGAVVSAADKPVHRLRVALAPQ
jgi:hypothetical protein